MVNLFKNKRKVSVTKPLSPDPSKIIAAEIKNVGNTILYWTRMAQQTEHIGTLVQINAIIGIVEGYNATLKHLDYEADKLGNNEDLKQALETAQKNYVNFCKYMNAYTRLHHPYSLIPYPEYSMEEAYV